MTKSLGFAGLRGALSLVESDEIQVAPCRSLADAATQAAVAFAVVRRICFVQDP